MLPTQQQLENPRNFPPKPENGDHDSYASFRFAWSMATSAFWFGWKEHNELMEAAAKMQGATAAAE